MPVISNCSLVHPRLPEWNAYRHSVQRLGHQLAFKPSGYSPTNPTFRCTTTLSYKVSLCVCQGHEKELYLIRKFPLLKRQNYTLIIARPFSYFRWNDRPANVSYLHSTVIQSTQTEPIQRNIGILACVILFGAIGGSVYIFTTDPKHSGKLDIELSDHFDLSRVRITSDSTNLTNMTEDAILSGHVGNLTSEQEEKLQLLWIATLQIFGVIDQQQMKTLNGAVNGILPILSRPSTPISEKAKKKKRGWFGRKSKDSDESDLKDIPVAGGDDKYGLASQFIHALDNASPEEIRGAFWSMLKHDHPDALLLRFLRARKWDVGKALVMMVSTLHWRAMEMHVDDDIMVNGEESMLLDMAGGDPVKKKRGADFLEQIRTGKSYLHGVDKVGRPMCFVRVRLHHAGDQAEANLERYTVYVIELARFLVQPPSDTACLVFDMTDFSLANMDYAPVKFMIKCFEANYPESLGVVLIHKAPWVFQGIWKVIRGLLDPVVANKVNFTNSVDDMEAFIERTRIPRDVGGDEDWELKYFEPVIGENELMKDIETREKIQRERDGIAVEFEKATIAWIEDSTNENAKDKRNELRISLWENYWKLDPYVRSRSFYDRAGIIQPVGTIQFYPDKENASTVPGVAQVAAAPPTMASSNGRVETSADDVD